MRGHHNYLDVMLCAQKPPATQSGPSKRVACPFLVRYAQIIDQPRCLPSMGSLLPERRAATTVAGLDLYARSSQLMIELMMAIHEERSLPCGSLDLCSGATEFGGRTGSIA